MNRKERRAAQKALPGWKRGTTHDQRVSALIKNGITPRDVQQAFDDGFKQGFDKASPGITKTLYAAVALALHDLYGYGGTRCKRVLERVDWYVLNALTSAEAIEEVYDRMGIILDFNEGIDRVR